MTPVQVQERQSFDLLDTTLLNPFNSNPLVMGEYLQFDGAFKLIRGDGSVPAFVMFDDMGRSDTQAIGKVTLLLSQPTFMGETLVFDNASPPALGDKLKVATVTNAAASLTNKSGLKTWSVSGLTFGYVLRTAANNGGYLRFISVLA
jgi:hypothetical protein